MMAGRTRKNINKEDEERIKEAVNINGTPPYVVAEWYDISEFEVRKICGLI